MNFEQAKKRAEELRPLLQYYTKKYFDDEQVVSDYEYDMLMRELKQIEKEYPELITEDSPTQRVGTGAIKKGFEKVTHEVPLQSLQDVFTFEEVEEFDQRMQKAAIEFSRPLDYVVETKIDGLSSAIEYRNGKLYRGATRGNGIVGEDVTQNISTIKHVPKELKEPISITVRGEVFIGKKDFDKLNEDRLLEEQEQFANARNAAAGSLRQLDSKITASRPLDIYVFNVQKCDDITFKTHYESLLYLERLGFNVNPVKILCKNMQEVRDAINKIGEMRNGLDFGIDGAVVKVNDLELREKVGTTYKTPRWAVAYKYPPEKKETLLKDIVCQVGRTGAITPMAILDPVYVAGSKISKTTLHNEDYIKQNDIAQDQRGTLKKYVETDCKLLCAVVTASKGFVRESVGDNVSEDRVDVITAAYSLVGKVGYFWGGKSTQIGKDSSWGSAAKVSAAGSASSGTVRAYGLDCSGFVTWSVINGYLNQGMQSSVGDGTSEQWENANVVSEQDAQPGDLVFQNGPEAGSNNHVGIICGKTDAGDWIAVHCSSSKNGVTVGEAYGASFRYIRQPSFYPTQTEVAEMENQGASADNAETDLITDNITTSATLVAETTNSLSDGLNVKDTATHDTAETITAPADAAEDVEITFEV